MLDDFCIIPSALLENTTLPWSTNDRPSGNVMSIAAEAATASLVSETEITFSSPCLMSIASTENAFSACDAKATNRNPSMLKNLFNITFLLLVHVIIKY